MNETAKLIKDLGGPAEVARRLNFTAKGSTQRVCNWITRNRIPLQIRVDHPDLFPMDRNPLACRSHAISSD